MSKNNFSEYEALYNISHNLQVIQNRHKDIKEIANNLTRHEKSIHINYIHKLQTIITEYFDFTRNSMNNINKKNNFPYIQKIIKIALGSNIENIDIKEIITVNGTSNTINNTQIQVKFSLTTSTKNLQELTMEISLYHQTNNYKCEIKGTKTDLLDYINIEGFGKITPNLKKEFESITSNKSGLDDLPF